MYSSGATDDMQIIFLLLTPIYFPWGEKKNKKNQKIPKARRFIVASPSGKGRRGCVRCVRDVSGIAAPGMGGCGRAGCGAGQGRSGWNGSATPPPCTEPLTSTPVLYLN